MTQERCELVGEGTVAKNFPMSDPRQSDCCENGSNRDHDHELNQTVAVYTHRDADRP